MSDIRIRPWGDTNPDNEIVVDESGGLPVDSAALVADGYEVGRISWEGVERTISVPALTSATDAADGSTASTGSVSTTIGDGTLYWVITQSDTSPSTAQVKAGNDHTGTAADDAGSETVSATGVQTMAGTGLTASTGYYTHFMHEDSAGNQSAVASASGFTTSAAATAPAQMSAPTVTATGSTSISVDRAAAPSDGGSAITSYDLRWQESGGSWTTVTGISDPETVSGLTASTLYNVQTRAVNAVGNGSWSASGSATTSGGSLLNFVDDFDGYVTGETLAATAGSPYDILAGGDGAYIREDPSHILRQEGNPIVYIYDQTVSADREVSLTIHQVSDGAGDPAELFVSVSDKDTDYVSIAIDAGGYTTIRQEISNVRTNFYQAPGSVLTAGDKLTLSVDGSTISASRNGTPYTLSGTYTPVAASVKPGFKLAKGQTPATSGTAISQFTVKEL